MRGLGAGGCADLRELEAESAERCRAEMDGRFFGDGRCARRPTTKVSSSRTIWGRSPGEGGFVTPPRTTRRL